MSETTQRIALIRERLAHMNAGRVCATELVAADVDFLLSLLDTWSAAKFIKVTKMDHEQQLRDIRFTISNDATMMSLIQEAALSCYPQPPAAEYRRRITMGIDLLVQAFGTHAVQMKEMQAELAKLQYQTEQSEPLGRGVDQFHAGQRITAVFHTQEVNEEFLAVRRSVIESVEQKCQPSSPSGSAAPCTPCCTSASWTHAPCTPCCTSASWTHAPITAPFPKGSAVYVEGDLLGHTADPDEDDDDEGLDTPDLETAVAIPECTCPPDHPLLSGHLAGCPCNRG